MRELFEIPHLDDPIAAARRGSKATLRRRFYQKATTVAEAGGLALRLDDKPVRTPARRLLAAPAPALAQAIAAEWQAQEEVVDPAKMPLTRLANAVIDGGAARPRPVAEEIAKY